MHAWPGGSQKRRGIPGWSEWSAAQRSEFKKKWAVSLLSAARHVITKSKSQSLNQETKNQGGFISIEKLAQELGQTSARSYALACESKDPDRTGRWVKWHEMAGCNFYFYSAETISLTTAKQFRLEERDEQTTNAEGGGDGDDGDAGPDG